MYVIVKLLNGFSKELTYKVPHHLVQESFVGKIVEVPLRNNLMHALVVNQLEIIDITHFDIKEIYGFSRLPQDDLFDRYIQKLAACYFTKPLQLYHRMQSFLYHVQDVLLNEEKLLAPMEQDLSVTLTEEQQKVVNFMIPFVVTPRYQPALLHGVTGSGKTEVYKRLIQQCIQQGKTGILLLPEVSLSMRFERILKEQLPSLQLYGFHSGTTPKEKKKLWQALIEKKPVLIIGVHLPILLPIPTLGLIIVDEEHESFQEMHHPKINSKDAAILRAHLYEIPILLGSATPAITSLVHVQQKQWAFFQLKQRFVGNFVSIEKVLLPEKIGKKRQFFWISNKLKDEIEACLQRKEQVILYLNRRGYSFFVQCKECSFIFECPHCSVSLTLHRVKKKQQGVVIEIDQLRCHYCDYMTVLESTCPSCRAPETSLLKKGIGTQQVVQMVQKLFPQARVQRADHDVTLKKNLWQETVAQFQRGEIDIFVGTKVITKGYHFPKVTLVGILWADLSLHFPDYQAGEHTLQQLIQVAGRAGRGHLPGKVIVQAMQDHDIFNYLDETAYLSFAEQEMAIRKELNYPPYCRLVSIEVIHKDDAQAAADADQIAHILRDIIQKQSLPVTVLGPAQPAVWKIQRVHMRHMYMKASSLSLLNELVGQVWQRDWKSGVNVFLN